MYTNDAVVDLCDILKLKRRTTTTTALTTATSPRAAALTTTLAGHQGQAIADSKLTGSSSSKTSVKDSSQRKVRLHSLDLLDVLGQQQQQHLLHSNVSSAADVASAVLSGTLHAAKSNDNLDTTTTAARSSKSIGGERVNRVQALVLPLCHRRCTPLTTSYADSSMSHSSDNEVEGEEEDVSNNKSSSITGSNDDDEDDGQQHHAAAAANHNTNMVRKNITNNSINKRRQHQQSSSAIVKQDVIITRKYRTKLDRILSVNIIVPFIHLPSRHTAANKILSRGNKRRKMTHSTTKKEVAAEEEKYVEVIVDGGMLTLK